MEPRHIKHKAFAYVTSGDRLLVLRHVHSPEAGLQVPAGTVEPHETPAQAVVREAIEETGLCEFSEPRHLGTVDVIIPGRPALYRRHFFHLRHRAESAASWQHYERYPSNGGAPILFELFWAQLPDEVPALVARHDEFLPQLIAQLRCSS